MLMRLCLHIPTSMVRQNNSMKENVTHLAVSIPVSNIVQYSLREVPDHFQNLEARQRERTNKILTKIVE